MISMFNECKILYILFGMYIELFLKYQTCKGFLYMVIKVDPIGDSNIIFLIQTLHILQNIGWFTN